MSSGYASTVSLVMAFRNSREFLRALPRKINVMSGNIAELILVDDNSTDLAAGELSEIIGQVAPRVRLINMEGIGAGVAAARNAGVSAASAEYIWFADIDDEWDPGIVDVMHSEAVESNADVVLCNARRVDVDGKWIGTIADADHHSGSTGQDLLRAILDGRVQGHLWNKLFRRDLLGAEPFPGTRAHSDLGGILAIAARAERVVCVTGVLYSYVMRSGSILHSKDYRWTDLAFCASAARRVTAGEGAIGHDTIDGFVLRFCTIPLLNEWSRRAGHFGRPSSAELRQMLYEMGGVRGKRLRSQFARQPKRALRALLGVMSPETYRLIYLTAARFRRESVSIAPARRAESGT
ncbi:glycosyltransferase [Microbacterium chocolatum]|uniref:glycosyltransferase n=1 Tax=Microbacterium aurantiacum TaxID=162393 RepID=UPI00338E2A12